MKRIAAILTASLAVATAQPAGAFDLGLGLFKRKPQANAPNTSKLDNGLKIKQLVATLQSDPDTDRRKVAAETLRTLDPRNNADVIPTLVSTLQNDPNAGVRAIAAESLGAIKSIYPAAGAALESSEKTDPDANVRAVAKASLWQYHLNGYKTPGPSIASLPSQTGEPPLAIRKPVLPPSPKPVEVAFKPITQGLGKGVPMQPTPEPPLAKPKSPPAGVPDVKPPMPVLVAPPIPVPMPMPEPMIAVPLPKLVPPISIPDVPKFPTGDGVPTVQPPKR